MWKREKRGFCLLLTIDSVRKIELIKEAKSQEIKKQIKRRWKRKPHNYQWGKNGGKEAAKREKRWKRKTAHCTNIYEK